MIQLFSSAHFQRKKRWKKSQKTGVSTTSLDRDNEVVDVDIYDGDNTEDDGDGSLCAGLETDQLRLLSLTPSQCCDESQTLRLKELVGTIRERHRLKVKLGVLAKHLRKEARVILLLGEGGTHGTGWTSHSQTGRQEGAKRPSSPSKLDEMDLDRAIELINQEGIFCDEEGSDDDAGFDDDDDSVDSDDDDEDSNHRERSGEKVVGEGDLEAFLGTNIHSAPQQRKEADSGVDDDGFINVGKAVLPSDPSDTGIPSGVSHLRTAPKKSKTNATCIADSLLSRSAVLLESLGDEPATNNAIVPPPPPRQQPSSGRNNPPMSSVASPLSSMRTSSSSSSSSSSAPSFLKRMAPSAPRRLGTSGTSSPSSPVSSVRALVTAVETVSSSSSSSSSTPSKASTSSPSRPGVTVEGAMSGKLTAPEDTATKSYAETAPPSPSPRRIMRGRSSSGSSSTLRRFGQRPQRSKSSTANLARSSGGGGGGGGDKVTTVIAATAPSHKVDASAKRVAEAKTPRMMSTKAQTAAAPRFKMKLDSPLAASRDLLEASEFNASVLRGLGLYLKLARQGDADAQSTLALAYWLGLGLEKNASSAVAWWGKAAKQGHASSQTSLGVAYMMGEGVAKPKPQSAVKHWTRAAASGDVMAMTNLGLCYMNGEAGLHRNPDKAVEYYRRAAERGYAQAQNNLGMAYSSGIGNSGVKDSTLAVEWYRRAAEGKSSDAENNMGLAYWTGNGVGAKDPNKAVAFWTRSAQNGNVQAQCSLGVALMTGASGVPKSPSKAVEWWLRAAEAGGNKNAQFNLSKAYQHGQGVPRSATRALDWARLAAEQGHEAAQKYVQDALERRKKQQQQQHRRRTGSPGASPSRGTTASTSSSLLRHRARSSSSSAMLRRSTGALLPLEPREQAVLPVEDEKDMLTAAPAPRDKSPAPRPASIVRSARSATPPTSSGIRSRSESLSASSSTTTPTSRSGFVGRRPLVPAPSVLARKGLEDAAKERAQHKQAPDSRRGAVEGRNEEAENSILGAGAGGTTTTGSDLKKAYSLQDSQRRRRHEQKIHDRKGVPETSATIDHRGEEPAHALLSKARSGTRPSTHGEASAATVHLDEVSAPAVKEGLHADENGVQKKGTTARVATRQQAEPRAKRSSSSPMRFLTARSSAAAGAGAAAGAATTTGRSGGASTGRGGGASGEEGDSESTTSTRGALGTRAAMNDTRTKGAHSPQMAALSTRRVMQGKRAPPHAKNSEGGKRLSGGSIGMASIIRRGRSRSSTPSLSSSSSSSSSSSAAALSSSPASTVADDVHDASSSKSRTLAPRSSGTGTMLQSVRRDATNSRSRVRSRSGTPTRAAFPRNNSSGGGSGGRAAFDHRRMYRSRPPSPSGEGRTSSRNAEDAATARAPPPPPTSSARTSPRISTAFAASALSETPSSPPFIGDEEHNPYLQEL